VGTITALGGFVAEARSRSIAWLGAGALAGIAAAGLSLLGSGRDAPALPEGAVATVNGAVLRTVDYQRALAALESDRRNPVGEAEQRFVLDRLVDEELLVQRALELGLAKSDRLVRNQLVAAMIASVTEDAALGEPDDAALRAFHAEHPERFTEPGRLRARQLWVRAAPLRSDDEARARAAEAVARLRAGEPFDAVAAALGDPLVAPLPDAPLPVAKLVEYAGPGALAALADAAPGTVSEPLAFAGGFQVLALSARDDAVSAPYESVADAVRAEWRRNAGDEALRRYLDELRDRAEIRMAGPSS
jgi:parvulin-like peptidyl-prolyl isomerase